MQSMGHSRQSLVRLKADDAEEIGSEAGRRSNVLQDDCFPRTGSELLAAQPKIIWGPPAFSCLVARHGAACSDHPCIMGNMMIGSRASGLVWGNDSARLLEKGGLLEHHDAMVASNPARRFLQPRQGAGVASQTHETSECMYREEIRSLDHHAVAYSKTRQETIGDVFRSTRLSEAETGIKGTRKDKT